MCVLSHFSHVQFFVPPWNLRPHQAPLPLGFSRQEYWSGLPFPSPGDLPDKGIKPMSPEVPALQADFFTTEPWGKPLKTYNHLINQVLSSPPWGDVETKAYRRVTNCPRSTRENKRVGIWIHIKIHHFNSMQFELPKDISVPSMHLWNLQGYKYSHQEKGAFSSQPSLSHSEADCFLRWLVHQGGDTPGRLGWLAVSRRFPPWKEVELNK